jgi:hypothetical protein
VWRNPFTSKRQAPAASRSGFLGEQGAAHYELKARLAQAFKGLPNVRAAYLARTSRDASSGLRLCVRTELGFDRCVLRAAEAALGSVSHVGEIGDVLFVDEAEEKELRRVAAPFYARTT